jgi:predicted DNA-binding antitoxin AbrB/MazE fold protein
MLRLMQTTRFAERYTLDSLFLELEKIKKISLSSGEMIVIELTRKQKDILAKLSLCLKKIGPEDVKDSPRENEDTWRR